MSKKHNHLARIPIFILLIFVSCNILIKAIIWTSALKEPEQESRHAITISQGALYTNPRYTTEEKQELFRKVDNLLTPVFIVVFVFVAIKLVKTPEIFKEQE